MDYEQVKRVVRRLNDVLGVYAYYVELSDGTYTIVADINGSAMTFHTEWALWHELDLCGIA